MTEVLKMYRHDRQFGKRWAQAVVALVCLYLCASCAIPSQSSAAALDINKPYAPLQEALQRQDVTEPGAVAWSRAHEYSLSEELRVIPHPRFEWRCTTEYVVNAQNIVVGFNLVGEGCRHMNYPSPWKFWY